MSISAKKKIVFVGISLVGGGAEKALVDIISSLDAGRYDIALALFNKKGVYVSAIPSYVRIYDLNKRSRYDFLFLIFRLTVLLKRLKPDTVISFLSYTNLITVLTRLLFFINVKVVIGEHIHVSSDLRHSRLRHLKHFLYGLFYNFADVCIVPSGGVKEDLVSSLHVKADKIKVVHNPIDLRRIGILKDQPLDFPAVTSGKYIISAGRLIAQKGYVYLLNAYSMIAARIDEKLLILGEGEERKRLESLTKKLGIEERVVFAGFQENPYKFMKNSSIFVLSSIYESFGLVIVEAMASGAAVIATDCLSGPGEIITNGINGILVPPREEKALADAMLELLKGRELRNRLIGAGKMRAKDFDKEKIVLEYEKFI